MIYKYISSKQIIAKVFADLDLKEESQRITDMREWIGEAYEKIGAIAQFIKKITTIPVVDHQATLPTDLHCLEQVAFSNYSDSSIVHPMIQASGSFMAWSKNDTDKYMLDISNSPLLYRIKPGFINTAPRDGFLKLSYTAIPLDSDGYPLIPSLVSYTEAIYWYILMKLKYPEYLAGRLNRDVYYDIRRSWNFYRNQAYAEAMMPDNDTMPVISNIWHAMVPNINSHSEFFADLNSSPTIYNKN